MSDLGDMYRDIREEKRDTSAVRMHKFRTQQLPKLVQITLVEERTQYCFVLPHIGFTYYPLKDAVQQHGHKKRMIYRGWERLKETLKIKD